MDDSCSQCSSDLIEIVDESPPPSPLPRSLSPARIRRRKRPNEPEVYCLAPAATAASASHTPTERLNFRFRYRFVTASGRLLDQHYPRVYRIHPDPSKIQIVIARILHLFPIAVHSWAHSWFPEWFLPQTLILKKQRPHKGESGSDDVVDKDLSDEYFETELKAYQRLRILQSHVVPTLFGSATIDGSRCLLLQDMGGVSLREPQGALLGLDELARLLETCLSSLTALGVLHGDAHPANFRLVNGRLMALDFEMSELDLSEDDNAFFTKCEIIHVGERYQDVRRLLWFEGFLQSASDPSS